jgi:collagenase-like PrtC family protease
LYTFNLPGGVVYPKEKILNWIVQTKIKIRDSKFNVFDCTHNHPWCGGRNNIKELKLTEELLNYYNRKNIGFYVPFSNYIIDLNDRVGNEILEMLNQNSLNGVIIGNSRFNKYVKQNYENLKTIRSITTITYTTSLETYKIYEDQYDYIVPRVEHILEDWFIDGITNHDKYELLLNDFCYYNCPFYIQHFILTSDANRLNLDIDSEVCLMEDKFENKDLISKEQFKRLIDVGFSNFKLAGRSKEFSNRKFVTLEKVVEYLLEIRRSE